MSAVAAVPRPSLFQSILEFRALFEMMSLQPARPMLRMAPRGEGQPVLVLPAFFVADGSTSRLRKYLKSKGFKPYAWEQGRNPGLSLDLYKKLEQRVLEISEETGRTVSLVGWSLGGLYARVLAHKIPDHVRQVVTLGSPFNVVQMGAVTGAVARLYERMNPNQQSDPMLAQEEFWKTPPPVPSTAIYSEGDGVAHWRFCIDEEDALTENLQIHGSHLGMTHNPLIMYAVADRLAQKEGQWQAFRLGRHLRQALERRSCLLS